MPASLDTDVTLRDGRAVHVRTVRPTDEEELLQAFARMGEDARYMRFMYSIREPNLERLRKALGSFPEGGTGIVATVPAADGADIVASAVYVIGKDPTTCEFAITVGSEFGGVGLARSLMDALIDLARQRGLKTMEGFVLAANGRMLRLAKRLGFSVAPDPEDRAVRICRLDLGAPKGASV
jgi:RimJ/RimL family protein N-acetyltransferase